MLEQAVAQLADILAKDPTLAARLAEANRPPTLSDRATALLELADAHLPTLRQLVTDAPSEEWRRQRQSDVARVEGAAAAVRASLAADAQTQALQQEHKSHPKRPYEGPDCVAAETREKRYVIEKLPAAVPALAKQPPAPAAAITKQPPAGPASPVGASYDDVLRKLRQNPGLPIDLPDLETILKHCATLAEEVVHGLKTIPDLYTGPVEPMPKNRDDCNQVVPVQGSGPVLRQVHLGSVKEKPAMKCVEKSVGRKECEIEPAFVREGNNMKYFPPGSRERPEYSLRPDVVLFKPGEGRTVSDIAAIYDFKFPCPPGQDKRTEWRKYVPGNFDNLSAAMAGLAQKLSRGPVQGYDQRIAGLSARWVERAEGLLQLADRQCGELKELSGLMEDESGEAARQKQLAEVTRLRDNFRNLFTQIPKPDHWRKHPYFGMSQGEAYRLELQKTPMRVSPGKIY